MTEGQLFRPWWHKIWIQLIVHRFKNEIRNIKPHIFFNSAINPGHKRTILTIIKIQPCPICLHISKFTWNVHIHKVSFYNCEESSRIREQVMRLSKKTSNIHDEQPDPAHFFDPWYARRAMWGDKATTLIITSHVQWFTGCYLKPRRVFSHRHRCRKITN